MIKRPTQYIKSCGSLSMRPNVQSVVEEESKDVSSKRYADYCLYPSPTPVEIIEMSQKCGNLYLSARFIECVICYEPLINKYPDYCVAYYNRGLVRYFAGDKYGARIDLERAISLGYLEASEFLKKYFSE
jgi:hypothetical protein